MMSIHPSEKYFNSLKQDISILENFSLKEKPKVNLLEWITMEFGAAWMDLDLNGLEELEDAAVTTT